MRRLKAFFLDPYVPMAVVLLMYALKVIAKYQVGSHVHSPMILGDAWHNLGDIVEASMAIVILRISRLPPSQEYPFGRKNLESLAKAVVGAFLCLMAAKLLIEAGFGLAAWVAGPGSAFADLNPFAREPLKVGPDVFWWVAGVTGGSILLSIAASSYQIHVGRASKSEIVVADGQETASDAWVEAAIFAGILGEHFFHEPRLECAFSLIVVWKLATTGRELFGEGLDVLLQRSLGTETEEKIRAEMMSAHGVADIAKLKSFKAGTGAVVISRITTRLRAEAQDLIRRTIAIRVEELLMQAGYDGAKSYLRFAPPDPHPQRVAYGIREDGRIAASLAEARLMRLCSIEDGMTVHSKDIPVPASPEAAVEQLADKRIELLCLTSFTEAEAALCAAYGIPVADVPTDDPEDYGI